MQVRTPKCYNLTIRNCIVTIENSRHLTDACTLFLKKTSFKASWLFIVKNSATSVKNIC